MKRPRTGWRLFAIIIPALIFIGGTAIFALNGWDYAQQTFLRSDHNLTMYQPDIAAKQGGGSQGTQLDSHAVTETANSQATQRSSPTVTKTPPASRRAAVVQTRRVILWPTLPTPGTKIGVVTFPTIGLNVPVVQGTYDDDLKLGAGHYIASPLPGQGGNVLLSGHRDTVFTKLKDLKVGAKVVFSTPYGNFIYRMTATKIVPKDNTTAVKPTNYETLTLTTCYPFYYIGSAPNRYIVYTKLVSEPQVVKAANGIAK